MPPVTGSATSNYHNSKKMSPITGSATSNYHNELMNNLWRDMADGCFNYGRISPDVDTDTIPNLKQANEDMVEYIISQLKIGKDSHILDLCSGRGMYTVGIGKRTGCKFTGTDINEQYLEESRKRAEKHGVGEQAEFICSTWEKMNEKVKKRKYTHIISCISMLYGHDVLDTVFQDIADCCDANTKVFLWDYIRKADWKDCKDANRHLKLGFPMANREEVVEEIAKSPLRLIKYEDFTEYLVPGYKVIMRECQKREPEMRILTYPLLGQAFIDRRLECLIFHLRLG